LVEAEKQPHGRLLKQLAAVQLLGTLVRRPSIIER